MKFRRHNWGGKQHGPATGIAEVIRAEVDSADYDGVNNKIAKLTELVGALATLLPETQQREFVEQQTYDWSPAKEK